MFKWLKKVMISIINAIKSLFVGDKQVQSVSIGDTQIYPNGVITYALDGTPWIEYSSGQEYITASGDDYARVVGTLVTYTDGVESGRSTVEYSVSLLSGDSSIWSVSGKHIFAAYRGTTTGESRSATFKATYSDNGLNYTYGPTILITQQANFRYASPGSINMFTVGEYYVEDTGETGDTTIQVYEDGASFSYTIYGTGAWRYTSGAISLASRTPEWEVLGVDSSNQQVSWVSSTHSSEDYESGTVTIDSIHVTTPITRTGYIKVVDPTCSDDVYARIPITQSFNAYSLTFAESSSKTILGSETYFSFRVVPKYNGTLISDVDQLSVQVSSSSTIEGIQVSSKTVVSSGGYVSVSFTCSQNSSSTSRKTASINFNYGGRTITATVTQEKHHPIPSFFMEAVPAINDESWWIGTINKNGVAKGIFIYSENQPSDDIDVNISLDWSGKKTGAVQDYEEQGITNTIAKTDTVGIDGVSRCGYWLVSNDAGGVSITDAWTITDFGDNAELYIVGPHED